MAHYRIIDTASWPRRDHFTFYRQFANPSFNLCVPIAAQRLYECAKERRVSFFQLALYAPAARGQRGTAATPARAER